MPARRVLIIEDNIDGARSLCQVFRAAGHHAEYAINGYVAMDMARQLRPEIVFLDIGLPGINGYEVCEALKKQPGLEATRIVVVTAYSGDEYRERSKAAGCDSHLVKPVHPQELLKVVDEL